MYARNVGALLASATLLAGCGSSGSDPSPDAGSGSPPPMAAKVTIRDFKFGPERLEVTADAAVTFANVDDAPHTATAKPGFDTGVLRKGQSKAVTIMRAGSYAYICDLHPYMKARIVAR